MLFYTFYIVSFVDEAENNRHSDICQGQNTYWSPHVRRFQCETHNGCFSPMAKTCECDSRVRSGDGGAARGRRAQGLNGIA